jgi:uncharacterized protein
MAAIKQIVLDVLKPHSPSIIDLTCALSDIIGIDGVNASVIEMDKEVETIKLTIAGDDINYFEIEKVIETMGGSIHSVDKVAAGLKFVKEESIHQDRNR